MGISRRAKLQVRRKVADMVVSSKYNAQMCHVEYHIDNNTEITVVFYLYNSIFARNTSVNI